MPQPLHALGCFTADIATYILQPMDWLARPASRRLGHSTSARSIRKCRRTTTHLDALTYFVWEGRPHYATGASTSIYGMFCGINNVNAHCEVTETRPGQGTKLNSLYTRKGE